MHRRRGANSHIVLLGLAVVCLTAVAGSVLAQNDIVCRYWVPNAYPLLPEHDDTVCDECSLCLESDVTPVHLRWLAKSPLSANFVEYASYDGDEWCYWPQYAAMTNGDWEWKVVMTLDDGMGTTEQTVGPVTFTVQNVVSADRSSQVLRYDPDPNSLFASCEIPYSITHHAPPAYEGFYLCAKVFGMDGQVVWHKHEGPLSLTAGTCDGTITWEGQTGEGEEASPPGTAPGGIYSYRVLATHGWFGPDESDGRCGDWDSGDDICRSLSDCCKSRLSCVSSVHYTHFEVNVQESKVKAKVGYTLSTDVDQCFLRVYDPTLTVVYSEILTDTQGTHETAQFEFPFVPLTGIGDYRAVVWAREGTEYARASNRDMQTKWALQRGSAHSFFPPAENWQTMADPFPRFVEDVGSKQEDYYLCKRYDAECHYGMGGRSDLHPRFSSEEDAIILIANHGHAGHIRIGPDSGGAGSLVGNTASMTSPTVDMALSDYDLSQCRLAIYMGCYSGETGLQNSNLLDASVAQGAEVAIGFADEIGIPCFGTYATTFFDSACVQHATLLEAHQDAEAAVESLWGGFCGFDSMVSRGPIETTIVPARYAQ